ncbi:hypothetical protein [Serratia sp. UGAL515B_01]|uniref:hypothetical protein n=1 Tax=Serratia sp. UGAL515B_01 TaxID=2986763 RepID=UPI00295359CD|nr:hypothetical protein [Serratia sp. UGAL515B_01]
MNVKANSLLKMCISKRQLVEHAMSLLMLTEASSTIQQVLLNFVEIGMYRALHKR